MGNEWINIKDRLPDMGGYYLCFNNNNLPFIAAFFFYVNEKHPCFKNSKGNKLNVTHWMPLPDPPESKNG